MTAPAHIANRRSAPHNEGLTYLTHPDLPNERLIEWSLEVVIMTWPYRGDEDLNASPDAERGRIAAGLSDALDWIFGTSPDP